MPYELSFRLDLAITDRDKYVPCFCTASELLLEQVEPMLRAQYGLVESIEAKRTWAASMQSNGTTLTVDIVNEDIEHMTFTIRLVGRQERWLLPDKECDDKELEILRATVEEIIRRVPARDVEVKKIAASVGVARGAA